MSPLGQEGICLSSLRPAGIARINDKRVNVISHSGFIDKDETVRVVAIEGNSIIVKKLS